VFEPLTPPLTAAAAAQPSEVPSFEQVYDTHFDFVWRYTRERGVPPHAVADVVQEIFIVIYRKLGSFEDRYSLQTWIAMVVRRAARDHLRKRGNRPIGEPLEERGVSSPGGPAEVVEQRATLRWLEHLLSRMTEIQREAFILHEIEHMTGLEISEALGVNENTVHARLRAARRIFESGVDMARARGIEGPWTGA
jgi:RNA polymerase sigma-70 factor (ECF subfamily)